MEKPTFSPYVLLPSSIVQSYASTSNSSPQIPAYNDLLQLQQELRGIQANLGNRRGKIGEDEEKLKNWTSSKVKGKGKERERSAVPSPAPTLPATNGTSNVDRKVLAKAKRESSGEHLGLLLIIELTYTQWEHHPLIYPMSTTSLSSKRSRLSAVKPC